MKKKHILQHIWDIIRNMFYRLIRGEKGLDYESTKENNIHLVQDEPQDEKDRDPIPFLKAQYTKYAPETILGKTFNSNIKKFNLEEITLNFNSKLKIVNHSQRENFLN